MERSSFFNAVLDSAGNPDRAYLAEDFARYFASFIGNGVFPNPSTGLQVVANDDMTITILKGKAWINGYFYENTDDLVMEITPADGQLNRIDRIVLELDYDGNREIKAVVKQGDFASSPNPKDLQRDADIYEIALADIKISNGATSISQSNITDLRLDNELCGIVHGVVDQVDTTTLFAQYQSWYEQTIDQAEIDIEDIKEQFQDDINEFLNDWEEWFDVTTQAKESEFDIWFDSIRGQLDGDLGAQLTVRVEDLENNKADISYVDEEIGNIEVTKEKVGLGNVDNVKQATKAEFDAHKADDAPHQYGSRFEWRYNEEEDSLDLVVIE